LISGDVVIVSARLRERSTTLPDVRRMECVDLSTKYRVIVRKPAKFSLIPGQRDSADTAGSTGCFRWTVRDVKFNIRESGYLFCVGDKDIDPARSLDNALVGICLCLAQLPGNPTTSW